MKKYSSIIYIVGLACAGLIFTGCATNQAAAPIPPNSGHLLINRVANFGSDLSLVVFVDGKNVGGFTEGRGYSGYLSAGQHSIYRPALIPIRAESAQDKRPWQYNRADIFLHRRLVGTAFDFGKESRSVGTTLLNRKVYLVGSVNLAVACWRSPWWRQRTANEKR